jgi:GNAT superfamily N-acetyltransferase
VSVCISTDNSKTAAAVNDQSAAIEIVRVQTKSQLQQFIDFPKHLLRDDANWIAPLDFEVKRFVSKKHSFREHGEAELLTAIHGKRVVGRLMVTDDPRFNIQHDSNLGCFGMFHSVDDQRVANQLLNAASRWLQARGRSRILGPIDYSTNYQTGLLIDGFDSPQRFLMNHNPPYYERLLENWGLRKAKDLYAWWFTRTNCIDDAWRTRVARLAKRFGVVIRPINMKNLNVEIESCLNLYNEAWQDNWGFVKMTSAEFHEFAHGLKQIADPRMVLIAEVKGKPVGLAITIPDVNEAIAPLNGRLVQFGLPVGLARMLVRMKKIKTGRLAALGVMPGYRRRGVAEMLIQRTFDYGKDVLGYTGAELSWTLEDNAAMNRSIERVGGSRYKTFRIYDREIVTAPQSDSLFTTANSR